MAPDGSQMVGIQPSDVADLPPSAKLVAKTLEYEGSLTQSQLAESTRLSARTVRSAVVELEKRGIVSSTISFRDARKRIHSLDRNASETE
ncbi:MarR family transcriptional regulator [Halobellus captivus]|uniref:MarR family transcriptional regulator n=1 Tax=Halobellus captivus TaxID=2592614 RepID=UPI0011A31FAB|nr:helix-turn-helix domain-containing protein [Halobellus captivus]